MIALSIAVLSKPHKRIGQVFQWEATFSAFHAAGTTTNRCHSFILRALEADE